MLNILTYCSRNGTTRPSSAAAGILRSKTLRSASIRTGISRYVAKVSIVACASPWLSLSVVIYTVGHFTGRQIRSIDGVTCYGFVPFSMIYVRCLNRDGTIFLDGMQRNLKEMKACSLAGGTRMVWNCTGNCNRMITGKTFVVQANTR